MIQGRISPKVDVEVLDSKHPAVKGYAIELVGELGLTEYRAKLERIRTNEKLKEQVLEALESLDSDGTS